MTVAILVPVLARPHRVRPLLDSIEAATPEPHRVLFLPDPDDTPERDAIAAAGADELAMSGGWAAKVNAGVRATTEPLLFLAADDLEFQSGWLWAARAHMRDGVQVVGVNDLIERRPDRRGHATHFLVTREYAQLPAICGAPGPVPECYSHSFCDDELIATAEHRGVYAYAEDAHVRHHHPMCGAPDDATYRKGRAMFRHDRRLFLRRRHLWT